MLKLYEDDRFKDITIQLDNGELKAHKCVLAVSSVVYFSTIFNQNWTETSSNVIKIEDCTVEAFEPLLMWCYRLGLRSKYNIIELLNISDRFCCDDFKKHLLELIYPITPQGLVKCDMIEYFRLNSPKYDKFLYHKLYDMSNLIEFNDEIPSNLSSYIFHVMYKYNNEPNMWRNQFYRHFKKFVSDPKTPLQDIAKCIEGRTIKEIPHDLLLKLIEKGALDPLEVCRVKFGNI